MKKLIYFIQFILLVIITFPLSLLPLKIALRAGSLFGDVAFMLWTSRRKIAIDNIRQAIHINCLSCILSPTLVVREFFRNLGMSIVELIKIYYNRGTGIIESVSFTGIEHLQKALSYEKGVILLTGHYGNWELLALSLSQKLTKVSVVARKQNNIYINNLVERVRNKYGNPVIYKHGALKKLLSLLKFKEVVGILFDQSVVESEGVMVDFLCRKAWTMKIPVLLAQKTGAPLIPLFIKRVDGGHTVTIHPPLVPEKKSDIRSYLQTLNGYLEEHIRDDPAQWLWIHRRWKLT